MADCLSASKLLILLGFKSRRSGVPALPAKVEVGIVCRVFAPPNAPARPSRRRIIIGGYGFDRFQTTKPRRFGRGSHRPGSVLSEADVAVGVGDLLLLLREVAEAVALGWPKGKLAIVSV